MKYFELLRIRDIRLVNLFTAWVLIKQFAVTLTFLMSLTLSAQHTEFWGTTPNGGIDGRGTIFSIDTNGSNQQVKHTFTIEIQGDDPTGKLVKANNGKLYGMTSSGGNAGYGVLFEYDPINNEIIKKKDFRGTSNGANPRGSLIQAGNEKLYGMTLNGGVNGDGVLFEYDILLDKLTKKWDFDNSTSGGSPHGSFIEVSNGKLYGMTNEGGINDMGILFEYDFMLDTLIKKVDFNGTENGRMPNGSLVEADSGKVLGLTTRGGINDFGVLFEYDYILDTLIKKQDFDGTNKGSFPQNALLKISNGNFYGTTWAGGTNNEGVLFEYNPFLDTLIKKQDFSCFSKGCNPTGSLVEDSLGHLYGITAEGGLYGEGVIYQYIPNPGFFNKKQNFECSTIGCDPFNSFVEADNGLYYGMTFKGGSGRGVLYEYEISTNTIIKKKSFIKTASGFEDGGDPYGPLTQADNGKLYGVAISGGENNFGIIYEFNPKKDLFVVKQEFKDSLNGIMPRTTLIKASNGNLYGVTQFGGLNNEGVLFEYNYNLDTLIVKQNFEKSVSGVLPSNKLIEGLNGKLYGTTKNGGPQNLGTLFEYDYLTDTFIVKQEFSSIINYRGAYSSSLVRISNSKFYGVTEYGGTNGDGLIYEYDLILDTLITKFNFEFTNSGRNPMASLLEAKNGKLYGTSTRGGINNNGVFFELDPITNVYSKIHDFDGQSTGSSPEGDLIEASNGKIYGMTQFGGNNNLGVIFEYDPLTDSLSKFFDFYTSIGAKPTGSLIEILACPIQKDTLFISACNFYTLPSGKDTVKTIGFQIIDDTLQNICGADSILTINLTISSIDTSITKNNDTLFANQAGAAYQWYSCDSNFVPVSGATNQSYSPIENGFYACEITFNGCTDTTACFQVIVIGLAEEMLQSGIKIYPNPVGDFLSIEMESFVQNANISIRNIKGQLVYENSNLREGNTQIDASNWSKGIYIIRIVGDDFDRAVKIVRQ